jgi:hypothetical protein
MYQGRRRFKKNNDNSKTAKTGIRKKRQRQNGKNDKKAPKWQTAN